MKKNIRVLTAKFYSFTYFIFWGFYFSAGYLFCNKKNKHTNFLMSV